MSTSIILKDVRLSYLNAWKPRKSSEDSKPRYSVSCILPKDHKQVGELREAIRKEIAEKWPDPKKRPGNLHIPLRDGDTDRENDAAYADAFFINASSDAERQPRLIDGQLQPVPDNGFWASGDYGNVKIDLFPFIRPEKKGIGVGLVTIQFTRKGEPLGNRTDPMEGFGVVEAQEPADDIFG